LEEVASSAVAKIAIHMQAQKKRASDAKEQEKREREGKHREQETEHALQSFSKQNHQTNRCARCQREFPTLEKLSQHEEFAHRKLRAAVKRRPPQVANTPNLHGVLSHRQEAAVDHMEHYHMQHAWLAWRSKRVEVLHSVILGRWANRKLSRGFWTWYEKTKPRPKHRVKEETPKPWQAVPETPGSPVGSPDGKTGVGKTGEPRGRAAKAWHKVKQDTMPAHPLDDHGIHFYSTVEDITGIPRRPSPPRQGDLTAWQDQKKAALAEKLGIDINPMQVETRRLKQQLSSLEQARSNLRTHLFALTKRKSAFHDASEREHILACTALDHKSTTRLERAATMIADLEDQDDDWPLAPDPMRLQQLTSVMQDTQDTMERELASGGSTRKAIQQYNYHGVYHRFDHWRTDCRVYHVFHDTLLDMMDNKCRLKCWCIWRDAYCNGTLLHRESPGQWGRVEAAAVAHWRLRAKGCAFEAWADGLSLAGRSQRAIHRARHPQLSRGWNAWHGWLVRAWERIEHEAFHDSLFRRMRSRSLSCAWGKWSQVVTGLVWRRQAERCLRRMRTCTLVKAWNTLWAVHEQTRLGRKAVRAMLYFWQGVAWDAWRRCYGDKHLGSDLRLLHRRMFRDQRQRHKYQALQQWKRAYPVRGSHLRKATKRLAHWPLAKAWGKWDVVYIVTRCYRWWWRIQKDYRLHCILVWGMRAGHGVHGPRRDWQTMEAYLLKREVAQAKTTSLAVDDPNHQCWTEPLLDLTPTEHREFRLKSQIAVAEIALEEATGKDWLLREKNPPAALAEIRRGLKTMTAEVQGEQKGLHAWMETGLKHWLNRGLSRGWLGLRHALEEERYRYPPPPAAL